MLSYDEALSQVLRVVPAPRTEPVPLDRALGRILAGECRADRDVPPFDKALMDGYAVRSLDLERGWKRFHIIGEAAAGVPCELEPGPAEGVRIMTGAPLPPGTDTVIPVEETELVEPLEFVTGSALPRGANVRPRAAEVPRGRVVLEAGSPLGSARIGVLASFGVASVEVYRRPRVALASTGDEVVAVDAMPSAAQIRDANGPLLSAQVEALGLEPPTSQLLPDTPEAVEAFLDAHRSEELLLLSGGLSMGKHDYVHQVLKVCGATVLFHKVAIKPGKPLLVARREGQLIFGLPGNPVSSWVTFHLFVRPAARKWMGRPDAVGPSWRLPLSEAVTQHPGRLFFAPGRLSPAAEGLAVTPVPTLGSSDLAAFSAADALFCIPADRDSLPAGALVDVLPLADAGL